MGLGFSVVEVTVALSVKTEPDGVGHVVFTVSVNCAVAPSANAPAVHIICPVAWYAGTVHAHPAGAANDEKSVFTGTVPVNVRFAASLGP